MRSELRRAYRAQDFRLHYQPIRDAGDLSLVAYESLLRWPHAAWGMVSPAEFIPVAERCSLIHDLGIWVLAQACRDLASLDARYVGVNVSASQLRRADFAARYARTVGEAGVETAQVTLEVTETVPLHDDGVERRNLHALRDLGCWLAIDDFGAGHATMDYLDKFPFNALKIDKAFIRDLGRTPVAYDLIASLCDLGLRRDVVVIAEGVETEEQLELLRRAGCPRVQGYLLGRPAPVEFWSGGRHAT